MKNMVNCITLMLSEEQVSISKEGLERIELNNPGAKDYRAALFQTNVKFIGQGRMECSSMIRSYPCSAFEFHSLLPYQVSKRQKHHG